MGNAADGSISFEAISYDEAGTYEYTISEVMPEDDDPNTEGVQSAGITYDQTVYNVKVTVEDNGIGSLVVAGVTYNDGPPRRCSPTPTLRPSPASIIFGATKVLEGRDLVAGEFTFELVDQDGNVERAPNGANGVIVFTDPVAFSAAGTYTCHGARGPARGRRPQDRGRPEGRRHLRRESLDGHRHGDGQPGAASPPRLQYNNGTEAAGVHLTPTWLEVPAARPSRARAGRIPDTGDHTSDALPAVLAVGGVAIAAKRRRLREASPTSSTLT